MMLSFQDKNTGDGGEKVMDAMNLLIVEDNPKMRRMINDGDGVTDDKDTDDDGDGEDDQPQFSQALDWLIRQCFGSFLVLINGV